MRLEAEAAAPDQQLPCRKSGGPLHARDGRFILKYFLIDRPRPTAASDIERNRDEIADLEVLDIAALLDHFAGDFVAQHHFTIDAVALP